MWNVDTTNPQHVVDLRDDASVGQSSRLLCRSDRRRRVDGVGLVNNTSATFCVLYYKAIVQAIVTVVLVVALVERRWTRDRKVAGSTPGRGAIKSTRSTQPSIPPGR